MSFGYRPILLYRSALLQSTSLGKATKFAASQYALMTSLCALPGSLLAGASGFVIKARRRMCPLYVTGLIGPGDRKSVQPMAARLAPGDYDQLHHFVAAGVWDAAPLENELLVQADKLVGGSDAVMVIDDTAVPKKSTVVTGVSARCA